MAKNAALPSTGWFMFTRGYLPASQAFARDSVVNVAPYTGYGPGMYLPLR